MKNSVLDNVAEDLFSTLPLIDRSIRRKLLKTALTSFNEDITPPHFEIMKLLEEAGTLHVAEIGERLRIARPQMTHLIDKLVALDIVERQTDKEDRRMLDITLTNNGKTIFRERDSHVKTATKEMLSCLTDKELQDLSASLRKLKDIFSKLQ
jgi:DNA-binding MarR family transcriptional regulator